MSHSSISAAKFGAKNLLRPLSQIRRGLERREEGQIPSLPAVLRYPAADQLQGWLDLILGKLVHQVMEFFRSSSRTALIDTLYDRRRQFQVHRLPRRLVARHRPR